MSLAAQTQTSVEDDMLKESSAKTDSLYEKLSTNVTWAKIFRWEFWPFSVLYFPVFFYWIWMTIRTRSFFFFTAANPTIHFGGMLGESKADIFKLIPNQFLPKTLKLNSEITHNEFKVRLKEAGLDFPFIAKPDIGERGWMVELIKNESELEAYLKSIGVDFLVQEYISYPVELGIFYYRYPDQSRGTVSSIVMKEMLSVVGDGVHKVSELMTKEVRAKMHIDELMIKNEELLGYLPSIGEKVEVVSIGNHCRGTLFMDGNHLITDQLIKVFDQISTKIDGFYFGRYDLRCTSLTDLYQGKNIKILELNGAGAEPAHIYQPGYSLIQAYRDILHHLRVLMEISMENKKRGIPYMNFRTGMKELKKIRRYNQFKR